jgi:hypothetical protein
MSKLKAVFKMIVYVSSVAAMALSLALTALTPFTATTVRAASCCLTTGCPQCNRDGVCNQGPNCGCDANNICMSVL